MNAAWIWFIIANFIVESLHLIALWFVNSESDMGSGLNPIIFEDLTQLETLFFTMKKFNFVPKLLQMILCKHWLAD